MNAPTLSVPKLELPPPRAPASSDSSGERYHHLDAVRAFALLLGIFFHAAESFGPRNTYWAIVDCSPTQLLEEVRFACHSFRLELFFIIAGFFCRLLLDKRGTSAFIRNRLQRILVPLVVGWLLLYPLLVLIWIWGQAVSGRLAQFGVPPEALNLPVWKLWLGFFLTGGFIQKFDLTHLWFLHQLLVLYAFVLLARWAVHISASAGLLMEKADGWFGRLMTSRFAVVCLTLFSLPWLLAMRSWGVDTPKESLWPHLPTTLLFGFCFAVGWFYHRQPELIRRTPGRYWWHLALGLLVWLSFELVGDRIFRSMTHGQLIWARIGFAVFYALMMWSFALGFLGLFTRYCAQPSAWSRYLADASYWMYIAHLPLVVALQVLIGRLPLAWPLKYAFILLVTFPVLFLSYHYLVRGTFIGKQLNGRRYPRVWPWQKTRP